MPYFDNPIERYAFQLGDQYQELDVSRYQVAGIVFTMYAVHGDDEDKFIFGKVSDGGLGADSTSELIADEPFLIGDDMSHEYLIIDSNTSWIQNLESMDLRLENPEYYSCLLEDNHWILSQFDSLEFLEGVIGASRWLKKDYHNIIKHLHLGDIPIDIDSLSIRN